MKISDSKSKIVMQRHPEEASAVGFIIAGSILFALIAVYFNNKVNLLGVSFLIFVYGLIKARRVGNRINQELEEERV